MIESRDGVGTPLERREAAYTYNANDQKLSLTDARGYKAEMRYDGFGRQQRWVFPSKSTPGVADQADYEQYLHDPNGNRVSLRKRDGRTIGYEYDPLNRIVIKYMPAPSDSVRYSYDLRGLQTGAWFTGIGWGIFNAYDGFGRLASTMSNMGGTGRTVSHKYDLEGRRTELAFPDGQRYWTARDGLGRAIGAYQGPLGSTSTIMAAFTFDPASQLVRFTRRFGDATVYGYDGIGRLAVLQDAYGGGGIGDTSSSFLYNPASQIRSETRTNDSYAWRESLAANRGYAVNGQNQYTGTTTGATFGYDPNGNLASTVNPPRSTSYVYDAENRLLSASGTENTTLAYDPLGRLFQISSSALGTTQFLYDGDELIAEYNASGNLLRRYVHGDGSDDPLFWYDGTGLDQPRFPHTNHQGSVVATAGLGGALLGINAYDEYGIPGANNKGRFQYTGQAWLPELGMYYYKARIYSPTLGRFLQVDPIRYDDQINLYAYVGNDPVNDTDPTGLAGRNRDGDVGAHLGALAELGIGLYFAETPAERARVWQRYENRVRAISPELVGKGKGAAGGSGVGKGTGRVERTASGKRVGEFSGRQKNATKAENAARNGGRMKCTDCPLEVQSVRNEKGVSTPANQAQIHHDPAIYQGGGKHSDRILLCPKCHDERHRKEK